MSWLRTLAGFFGDRLPEGFSGELAPGENALAAAVVATGGHLVVTELGLWLPSGRRAGWDKISKATWGDDVLTLIEAEEIGTAGEAVLVADTAPQRFTLPRPGKVPHMIRQRIEGSIRERHRHELNGGGVWFVQRKVPGRDGTVLQARPDPGVDPTVVAAIAREAAEKLARPES